MFFEKLFNFIYSWYISHKFDSCGKNFRCDRKINIKCSRILVGDNVHIQSGVLIFGSGEITIGNNTVIGKDTIIFSDKKIFIGNDVLIAAQTYIVDSDHGIRRGNLIRNQAMVSNQIYIGNDVWIGAGSKILKGSIIHDGAVIGALSLVKHEIESNSINVGIPSKTIKYR